jgi:hypothetical protein
LPGSDFSRAILTAPLFHGARLQGAIFSRASALAADFEGAHLQASEFSNSTLTAATFDGAFMQYVILNEAFINGASFPFASLSNASLKCVAPFRTYLEEDFAVSLKSDLFLNAFVSLASAGCARVTVHTPPLAWRFEAGGWRLEIRI